MLMLLVLRQKKICVFPVTCLKIIGSDGRKLLLFFLGSGQKVRVGQVTGNTHIFFRPNIDF